MWSADLTAAAQAKEPSRGTGSLGRSPRMARAVPNVMAAGVRARLNAFEQKTGGRGTKWYRITYALLHLGKTVDEVADELELMDVQVMGVLRLAVLDLVRVYGLGDTGKSGSPLQP